MYIHRKVDIYCVKVKFPATIYPIWCMRKAVRLKAFRKGRMEIGSPNSLIAFSLTAYIRSSSITFLINSTLEFTSSFW